MGLAVKGGDAMPRLWCRAALVQTHFIVCGTQVAHTSKATKKAASFLQLTACILDGALGEIRTHGLWLRRPTLYPTELRAHKNISDMLCAGGCQGQQPMGAAKAAAETGS